MKYEYQEKESDGILKVSQGAMLVGRFKPLLQVYCDVGNPGPIGIADSFTAARTMLQQEVELRLAKAAGPVEDKGMNLPDVETVAAMVHNTWMDHKLKAGIESRISETGEELMVDYSALSEPAKEIDRVLVRTVYAAIDAAAKKSAGVEATRPL